MADSRILTREEILPLIPQQDPFRFVDEILELSDERVVGRYTWNPALECYRGHFPGNPVTPGVLLIECMAQCGVVPLGIFFSYRDHADEAEKITTFFTEAEIEFNRSVYPGDTVTVESQRVFYRRRKLKIASEMKTEDGTVVCSGTLAGIGVTV